jgi:hypothetical protein
MMMHYLIVVAIAFVFICHARKMDACTPMRAKIQHGGLMLCAVASLPMFGFGAWLLGAGALCYAAMDARGRRWSCSDPLPTIDDRWLRNISGGRDD